MKREGLITLNDDAVRRSVSQIVTVLKDMLSANYAGSLVLHALALHVLALPPQAIPKLNSTQYMISLMLRLVHAILRCGVATYNCC